MRTLSTRTEWARQVTQDASALSIKQQRHSISLRGLRDPVWATLQSGWFLVTVYVQCSLKALAFICQLWWKNIVNIKNVCCIFQSRSKMQIYTLLHRKIRPEATSWMKRFQGPRQGYQTEMTKQPLSGKTEKNKRLQTWNLKPWNVFDYYIHDIIWQSSTGLFTSTKTHILHKVKHNKNMNIDKDRLSTSFQQNFC